MEETSSSVADDLAVSLARFAGRTFHHADFDAGDLVRRKDAQGLTVSVVIPARNEEGRVGRVARILREALVDDVPLVDDLLVVDGDSTDATAVEAAAAGVRVLRQSRILPEAGSASGKGEALWKGLAATTGDLVVFVDADIEDIDARFVAGLLGPLLTDPGVAFVKATYDRPLRFGDELRPGGGGRVTELLARPLLATFWPELSWLAQPLSGEYAGRRPLLESLPFVRGYGIELAMLVDIADRHGVDVIAQVDLDVRVHENQPIDALGRMASEILQVAMQRLSAQGRMVLTDPPASLLAQPVRDGAGDLALSHVEISPSERPPLAEWRAAR
ncbi:MAG: glucosyl-3-phosphoglycerate synthase [Actinobacteria bacterium]|nr:glucosyl-3-phosphoglycerate synthase [Actinomycetota bacterium]